MPQDKQDLLRRIYDEAFNKGNVDVLDGIVTEDYQRHQPPYGEIKSLSEFKKFVTDVRNGYSGFSITLEEMIISGEKSVVRVVLQGRHTGQTPTVQAPPTGKQIAMTGCTVSHWSGDKISEEWAYNDYLGLTQQFGVVPPPGMY